jgi:hypothetical protein
MSHFTVAVFTDGKKDIEELLAPFHEFECTGEDDQYVQDIDITQEIIEHIQGDNSLSDALEYFGLENCVVDSEEEVNKSDAHKYGYAIIRNGQLIKAVNRTNPNKKWDWWDVGGRWRGMVLTKGGIKCDVAKVVEIDFEAMNNIGLAGRKSAWDQYHEEIKGKEDNQFLRKHIYGIPQEVTSLEQFLALQIEPLSTYAVITPDGQWHAPGTMGWFGFSSESDEQRTGFKSTFYDQFIKSALENDWSVTIVDCHI